MKPPIAGFPLLLATIAVCLQSGSAFAIDASLLAHPNKATADYYAQNAASVDALDAKVADKTAASSIRLEAFDTLELSYPDAAFLAAVQAISDPDVQLAVAAATNLAGVIAMSNHPMTTGSMTSTEHFIMEKFDRARDALRSALADERKPVREVAAETLSSLADVAALDQIADAAKSGKLDQSEAVNYFGLANPDIGAKYIEPYITEGQTGANAAAVAYLASNPMYQVRIREAIFLNPSANPDVRTVAADKLSEFDPSFSTYGLAVAKEPAVPAGLYAKVLEGYIDNIQSGAKVGPAQVKLLKDAVDNFSNRFPADAVKAQSMQERVKGIEQ